jgi:7-cyano-7-deazaguanine synthase in queuosine biosynthesis
MAAKGVADMKSTRRSALVVCKAYSLRDGDKPQTINFGLGKDLLSKVTGLVGPHGLSPAAADLIDVASSVFEIEKQLRGRQRTNPVVKFDLAMPLRNPSAWGKKATATLCEILDLLGYPVWNVRFDGGLSAPVPIHQVSNARTIDQIALFSGGLDSACGAISLRGAKAKTQLVSYYTGQKSLQAELAQQIGFDPPVQWSLHWERGAGRGHSYFYRSFLFLALAAATAETWGARRIFQFENGVLATAVPPSPAFAMTHHAHPSLHRACAQLFGLVLGGQWTVENPFLNRSKCECVQLAIASKLPNVEALLHSTQTCWFYRSNRILGANKRPNTACGVCIPCVLRGTALSGEDCEFDLKKDSVRNHRTKGRVFRSYYGFLSRILSCDSANQFYAVLPAAGRDLLATGTVQLADLYRLFRQFANEFMKTYAIKPEVANGG